ncbi:MAG: isoamylase [Treponema sp.]|jgi:hypothetical protein|nr:isoamylase [Treponema sp.]
MKKYIGLALLVLIIGKIGALDTESSHFIDYLLGIERPGSPRIFQDGVVFTAPSSYRSVGIAFAHEGFATIHWFKKLLIPVDMPAAAKKESGPTVSYEDSGFLFYAWEIPPGMREAEYRLVINGLWTSDPLNSLLRRDPVSGLLRSVVALPDIPRTPAATAGPAGTLSLSYQAPSGETVTVAGDFNGWDPFMYELRETAPGLYTMTLPLPPGTYHYVFYHRGRRIPDPNSPNWVYTANGEAATEVIIR